MKGQIEDIEVHFKSFQSSEGKNLHKIEPQ